MSYNSRSIQLINCRQLSQEYVSKLLDTNNEEEKKQLCNDFAHKTRIYCPNLEDSECLTIFKSLLIEEIDYRQIEEFDLDQ